MSDIPSKRNVKNPLMLFGLVFLAGDGPLLSAYFFSKNELHSNYLLFSILAYILLMTLIFGYLVIFKPRNLYSPNDIPSDFIGKSIYKDNEENQGNIEVNILPDKISENNYHSIIYDLLLLPGYNITLIYEILESIELYGGFDSILISEHRKITPSTVDSIVNSMLKRNLLKEYKGKLKISEQGNELLNQLKKTFHP